MTPAPKGIWTYAYRLDPPQSAERLRAVKVLLEQERIEQLGRAGTWNARLVTDERVTDILVVSDSPHADGPVNATLERALRILGAGFERTAPLAVAVAAAAPAAMPAAPRVLPPATAPRLPRKK